MILESRTNNKYPRQRSLASCLGLSRDGQRGTSTSWERPPLPPAPLLSPSPPNRELFPLKKTLKLSTSHYFTEQEKNRLRPFSAVVTENTENQKKRYLFRQPTFLQPLPGHFGPGSAQRHRKRRTKRKVGGGRRGLTTVKLHYAAVLLSHLLLRAGEC